MSKLISLLFPRKCSLCSAPLHDAGESDALCPECMLKYSMMCEERCSACGERQRDCRCERIDGADISLHLFEFASDTSRKLIYTLKRKNDKYLQNFIAAEAAAAIEKTVKNTYNIQKYKISYVPRNPASIRDFGFDQSKLIASKISKITGCEFVELFVHEKHMKTQKEISASDRKDNAQQSYNAKKNAKTDGTVVIIDDVTTSGSTLARCSELARGLGAENVLAFAVAMTPKRKKTDHEKNN